MSRFRNDSRETYAAEVLGGQSPESKAIRAALAHDGKLGINLGPLEGRILQFFIRSFSLKRILEIGTLYGTSALWMAEALPPDGKITCLEKNEGHFEKARALLATSPHASKIDLRWGDARELLSQMQGRFDLVFIDANKADYLNYLDWAEAHLNPRGFIVGDNTFLFGHVYGEGQDEVPAESIEVMKEFNRRLADPARFETLIIPTVEGLTIARALN